MKHRSLLLSSAILLALTSSAGVAQGPRLSYLTDPATVLPWASCYVYLRGGSQHKIPFLPVVSAKAAPCGTAKYTQDVHLDAPIVFVGNGIARPGAFDCYRGLDVAGKIVMFAYDFPDTAHADLEKRVTLEERIADAMTRKAAGIVLFSARAQDPFPMLEEADVTKIPEIPIVAINRESAATILGAAGTDAEAAFDAWKSKGEITPASLICRLKLDIDGRFARIDGSRFTFCFEKGIGTADIQQLAAVNEQSVDFALNLFKEARVEWQKSFVAYFRDYDSKLFYTHHWGSGMSCDAGTFMVYRGASASFGLAVHENTHTLLGLNWGDSSSFLIEGLGRYAEAMATDKDRDHRETIAFLGQSKLFPLVEMAAMEIGPSPRTDIAYPGAGSFVAYLIATYRLDAVKKAYQLEARSKADRQKADSWTAAFGKPLEALERDWRAWLGARFSTDR